MTHSLWFVFLEKTQILQFANFDDNKFFHLLFRYELVPKKVREDEFWRNYFYRVSLIKQSFDLKDFETENSTVTNQQNSRTENIQPSNNEEEVVDHHLNKYELI